MICGIDAGGTKTRFIVYQENGTEVLRYTDTTMHFMKVGFDGISEVLERFKKKLIAKNINPDTLYTVMGMAGYGEDKVIRRKIENAVYKVLKKTYIISDAQLAHIASFKNQDGLLLISGTGSILIKKENKQFSRLGGFGYLIDDAGSGFFIGKEILTEFSRQISNQNKKTKLYAFLKETLKLEDDYDIIRCVNDQKEDYRQWVANLAYLTKDLDDEPVMKIHQQAGKELADMVNSIKEPLNVS
ncbi:MAG TPA: BadF/BadG/BcrA/BcrD ATPase family protein, partial [Erysipelothrix sp.]|nr:BadF/BadG/BcrA/BcrD ATPase family protein [Erysipelothrix sp.]